MSELAKFRDHGFAHVRGMFSKQVLKQIIADTVDCGVPKLPAAQHIFQPADAALLHFEPLFTDSRLMSFAQEALRAKVKLSLLEYVQTPQEDRQYDGDSIGHGWDHQTRLGIHRDGAWIDRDLGVTNSPMLTLKAAIWLSDVGAEAGNLRLWPKSHQNADLAPCFDPEEYVDVAASAGDVTWFDRRIFHSRTHNLSRQIRRVVFVEYSVTWIKRKQDFHVSSVTLGRLSPLALLLLQDPSDPWTCYWP